MKTQTLNIIHDNHIAYHRAGTRMQVIDYRGVLITRQFDQFGYSVTIDLGTEEADFNSVTDAIRWVEDELNTTEFHRHYRCQEDLHREWAVR